jgi:hypothetical protein
VDRIEFLKRFHPEGFWVLTAIQVDRKGIETVTFTPDQADKAKKWLNQRAGKANLYFMVNQPGRRLTKKATRDDIVSVGWLHVDIDGRSGEPLDRELDRIRDLLENKCPVPPPTVVINSGGGFQAFWRLIEPVPTTTLQAKSELTRYNKQLEIVFGGDSCHNIDRIMRLPNTLNIPNARKVERGRVPVMSEVHWFEPDHVYELSHFNPAPDVQTQGYSHLNEVQPPPSGNIARLDDVDELDKWKVPDRVKVILVQGSHPDEIKEGDNSRSAWLFDAVCNLVRCGVTDEVIFSIITDPDLGISASVLDKRPNEAEYAMRQIGRAKEEVEEPWLRKLNDKFAVIGNLGGKCRIIEERNDAGRQHLTKQTFTDFRNRYSNIYIQVGKRTTTVGNWWLAHPTRRQYEAMTFSPGQTVPGVYNLWQGFYCPPLPGDRHHSFLEHLYNNVCSGVRAYYDYLIGWSARAVQKPDRPGETAIVMRGKPGTGKSFFANQFGKLFGRHYLHVSNAAHLIGQFNSHLRDCVVVFGDEAFYAGDKKHESVLKTLITEEHMMIEQKGVDAELSPNFTHLILASNEDWVVPAGPAERRFFVLDVGEEHQRDTRYFRHILADMNSGGRENLLHYLLTYDLDEFEVRDVPTTQALQDQKLRNLDPMHDWWHSKLMDGKLLTEADQYSDRVACNALRRDYVDHARQYSTQRLGTATKLGLFLNRVCPQDYPRRFRSDKGGRREYVYQFPSLAELRQCWDQLFDQKSAWPEEAVEQTKPPF